MPVSGPATTLTTPTSSTSTQHSNPRVYRSREYICYICQASNSMQIGFVDHMKDIHPGQPFNCDYCSSKFFTANGYFKHVRSHEYLKHQCLICAKRLQFPYQLEMHMKTHTKENMWMCTSQDCGKQFASKSSRDSHSRSHGVSLQCGNCPETAKRFSSQIALSQHIRGKHGPGWKSPCGLHFQWKSKYSRHINGDCKICTKSRADKKLNRYAFLREVELD